LIKAYTSLEIIKIIVFSTILATLALSVLVTAANKVNAQADKNGIFPIDSKPYGKVYSDWTIDWWKWFLSFPNDRNPSVVNDNTGKLCSQGQNGPVWFLPTMFNGRAERTCNIPSDKGIIIEVYAGECSYIEYPQYKTESELRSCAGGQIDKTTSLDVSIDGKKIPDLRKYRVQSPLFDVTFANNNAFGKGGGPTKAISDGYWLILSPLSLGKHRLDVSGSSIDLTSGAPQNAATVVTYNLNIIK
jgi:hypothetical protein